MSCSVAVSRPAGQQRVAAVRTKLGINIQAPALLRRGQPLLLPHTQLAAGLPTVGLTKLEGNCKNITFSILFL